MRQTAGGIFAAGTAGLLVLLAAATSTAATGPAPRHALTPQELARCRTDVTALVANELLQVAAGRPDVGTSTSGLIEAANHDNPALGDRVQQAERELMLTATADLLSRYEMNISAEMLAYSARLVAACNAP